MTKLSLFKNKKGFNFTDSIFLIVFLVMFGVTAVIAVLLTNTIIDNITATGFCTTAQCIETSAIIKTNIKIYDPAIVFLLIGMILSVGYMSFRVATHPAFFLLIIIVAPLMGYVSYFFNFFFIQFASEPELTATMALFPITLLILTNLHWVMIAILIVGSLTFFGKREKGQFLT